MLNFNEIDSQEKAVELYNNGELEVVYGMPLRFGGDDELYNMFFVPLGINEIKEGYDDIVEQLLIDEKVSSYNCDPSYKGESFIPSKLTISAMDDNDNIVFQEKINIW